MAEKHDYDEISDKNISEIKDIVKDKDLDLKKLLEVEKDNKDRKTLKDWLEKRIDREQEKSGDKEEKEEFNCPMCGDSFSEAKKLKEHRKEHMDKPKRPARQSPAAGKVTPFLIGLIIGGLLVWLLMFGAGGPQASTGKVSPEQAKSQAQKFLQEQVPSNQANFSLGEVNTTGPSDMYIIPVSVQSPRGEQNIKVFVTKDSGLMFAGVSPIDLDKQKAYGNAGPQRR